MSDARAEAAPLHRATLPFGVYERVLALRYLFATRKDGGVALMSIIAFVGVALAVMALISVMSIMNGFRYELLSRLLGIDGHIYVQSLETGAMPLDRAQEVSALLREMPGVAEAYPMVAGQGLATSPGGEAFFMALGMTPENVRDTPFIANSLVGGGNRDFGAGRNGGDVIYVGTELAQTLGAYIGDQITLSGVGAQTPFGRTPRSKAYTIGDLVDTGLEDYNGILLYMPLNQAQLFFNKQGVADQIQVRLRDPEATDAVRTAVRRALGPNYLVTDWRDKRASLFNALQVERSAMRLILMLVVLIAALNIISGFTMLVRAKSRDIAILRTVGVDRGSVLRIFLMSGAMLGLAGTLAGLALGVLFCTYIAPIQGFLEALFQRQLFAADVYGLDHLPALLDWNEVWVISAWGFGVSVFVTLIPAWFAARLDPVEALRYE